jgi:hypothetical protein
MIKKYKNANFHVIMYTKIANSYKSISYKIFWYTLGIHLVYAQIIFYKKTFMLVIFIIFVIEINKLVQNLEKIFILDRKMLLGCTPKTLSGLFFNIGTV